MEVSVQDLCQRVRACGMISPWNAVPDLGALMVSGAEAGAFLQSQLTSDVDSLPAGGYQLSARTDRKGRLLAWFHLYRLPDRGQPHPVFLLLLPRDEIPTLASHLQDFIISEDVFLEDASDHYDGLLLAGPDVQLLETGSDLNLPVTLTGDPGLVCLWPKGSLPSVLDHPLAKEAQGRGWVDLPEGPTGHLTWQSLRVEAGWPLVGTDLESCSMVLTQTGLEPHVVSHSKGCYLGQEVLARVRTYGSVKLALRGVVFETGDETTELSLPKAGSILEDSSGNGLGRWASSTWSTVWQAPVALVFLNRQHRTPGETLELDCGGINRRAKVVLLPFHEAGRPEEKARNLYDRAIHFFNQGNDREAASLLEEAIRHDPGHADSYEALGVILGRAERHHEAIDIFHRLEEVAPQEPMVHTNLSLYYMKLGDKEQAERHKSLATLKRFGADDPDIMLRQAEAEKQARLQEATRKRALFSEVLEMDPADGLALMGMGNALIDLEEFVEAEDCLGRAIVVQESNSALYLAHGKVLAKLQRKDEARQVLKRGVVVASRQGDLMPLREMEHRLLMLG